MSRRRESKTGILPRPLNSRDGPTYAEEDFGACRACGHQDPQVQPREERPHCLGTHGAAEEAHKAVELSMLGQDLDARSP